MDEHVTSLIPPVNPIAKAAMLDRNRRAGWRQIPGTLDPELGWFFDPENPTAPLWIPRIETPPHRTIAAPAHWARLWTALGLLAGLAALAGLAVR